ncbi:hypothetical protein ACZ90_31945 [Streptomyces albus subsp. albus]|nr:hypothetical protein ACZ90_31945 [Streptomyces albus subsp. albus]
MMVAGAVLTGCSSGDGESDGHGERTASAKPTQDKGASGQDATGGKPAASSGRQIGAKGSACRLPVTFALAASWKPKAVEPAKPDDPLAELTQQGETQLVCEIDAKPAGNVGFLRVWTGPAKAGGGDARKVLEGYLAAKGAGDVRKPKYHQVTVGKKGTLPATEVVYTTYSKLMEESKQERALALMTPGGAVVLHLGGMDSGEHQAMLPAYELAKSSLAVSAG